jgi:cysteine desulfurase
MVITTSVEHPAILAYLKHLQKYGRIDLIVLPVTKEGFVLIEDVEQHLTTSCALVTIMHSNNEVGTIQPIGKISKAIQDFNSQNGCSILFHSDAAQSAGKVGLDVNHLNVDMLTIVGHKYGAPKGIAALYLNKKVKPICPPLLYGGGQEAGLRAGNSCARFDGLNNILI